MVSLVLVLLVFFVTVSVLLFISTLFLQNYFYTEPTPGVLWKAPVAGLVVTAFLYLWCMVNINDSRASLTFIPYDTIFRFSPDLKLTPEPVKKFWTIRKGEKQEYTAHKIPQGPGNVMTKYYLTGKTGEKGPIWNSGGVESIIIEHEGQTYQFEPRKAKDADYPTFESKEGWVMTQYDNGVTGLPHMFSTALFFANIFLNLLHLGIWFVCLWLLLRFQWSHALLLALPIWVAMTFIVVPMLLGVALTPSVPG